MAANLNQIAKKKKLFLKQTEQKIFGMIMVLKKLETGRI